MNTEVSYPTLGRRYLTTALDGFVMLGAMIVSFYLVQGDSAPARLFRICALFLLLFVYEPLCISRICTIGQKIMGVRVRNHKTLTHITIPQAYFRIVVKLVLGVVSFFTLPFNREHRAIHDIAADSVVVYAEEGTHNQAL